MSGDREASDRARPRRSMTVAGEGLVAGLAAYAAVVLVVTAADLVRGHAPYYTAARIGAWFLVDVQGGEPESPVGPVLVYNGVHMAASLAAGLLGSALVRGSERLAGFWYVALMLLLAAGIYIIVMLGAVGAELLALLDWTTVVLGTVAWLAVLTTWFWKTHALARRQIEADLDASG